jgi:hypothetical protein
MALGRGGWHGIDLVHGLLDANEECDMVCWGKPIYHVAGVLTGPSKYPVWMRVLGIVDAGSKGTNWRPLFNPELVAKVRRLTIGDKK